MAKKPYSVDYSCLSAMFRTILAHVVDGVDPGERPHLLILGTGARYTAEGMGPLADKVIPPAEDGTDLPSLLIVCDGLEAYLKTVEYLEGVEDVGYCLGRTRIQDRVAYQVQRFACRTPEDEEGWRASLKEFVRSLRGSAKRLTVYVPVSNLVVSEDVVVGGVKFHRKGFENEAVIKPTIQKVEGNAASHTAEEMAFLKHQFAGMLLQYSSSACCAEVWVNGCEDTVADRAYEIIRNALNLLRCYIPVIFGTSFEHRVGLRDDIAQSTPTAFVLQEDGTFNLTTAVAGYIQPYEL